MIILYSYLYNIIIPNMATTTIPTGPGGPDDPNDPRDPSKPLSAEEQRAAEAAAVVDQLANTFTGRLRKTAGLETHLQGSGTMALIDIPENANKLPLMSRLHSLIDSKTGYFGIKEGPEGTQVLLASVGETASRNLIEEFLDILKNEFREDGVIIRTKEGEIVIRNRKRMNFMDAAKGCELLQSLMAMNVPEKLKRGLITDVAQIQTSEADARGARISDQEDLGGGLVLIKEVEKHSTNIQTGGPREVIGRTEELALVKEYLEAVKSGEVRILPIAGKAGVGKSRLLVELKRLAGGLGGISITESVANKHEAGSSFKFIRRGLGVLLKNNTLLKESEEYKTLSGFLTGNEEYEGVYSQPDKIAAMMGLLMRKSSTANAILLDDLQWCDPQSAVIIAELIRQLPEDSKELGILVAVSSRKGREDIPKVIQAALDEKEIKAVEVKELEFMRDGKETEVFKEYVRKSFSIDADTSSVPDKFWTNVGRIAKGNPFVLTCVITHMERDGKLKIDSSGHVSIPEDIDYSNYTMEALFRNMIDICTPEEKGVLRALKYFKGCKVHETLFLSMFPELHAPLVNLIESGWVLERDGDMIQPQHDLLREEMEGRFEMNPLLAWDMYKHITTNPTLAEYADAELLFELTKPALEDVHEIQNDALRDTVILEGWEQGMATAREYKKEYRHSEVRDILQMLLRSADLNALTAENPEELLEFFEILTDAHQSLGDTESMLSNLQAAQSVIGARSDLKIEFAAKELEILFRLCDAYYLELSNEAINKEKSAGTLSKLRGMIALLKTSKDAMERSEHRKERVASKHVSFMVGFNEVRSSYQEGDKKGAMAQCNTLLEELKKDVFGNHPANTPVPVLMLESISLEYAQLYLELERFRIKLISEQESAMRGEHDADAKYRVSPTTERAGVLNAALKANGELLKTYDGSTRQLARTSKDRISAQTTQAKLLGLISRGKHKEAMKMAQEAARNASNFEEKDLYGIAQKIIGDILTSTENPSGYTLQNAITAYRKGMDEVQDGVPSYANLAASAARAIAMKGILHKEETTDDDIRRGWGFAMKAYEMLEGSNKDIINRYLVPYIGHLIHLGNQRNIKFELPAGITPEDVAQAYALLAEKKEKCTPIKLGSAPTAEIAAAASEAEKAVALKEDAQRNLPGSAATKEVLDQREGYIEELERKLEGLRRLANLEA